MVEKRKKIGLRLQEIETLKKVFMPASLFELLTAYTIFPKEICGTLYGEITKDILYLSDSEECNNYSDENNTFMIKIDEILTKANAHVHRTVGIFHSHGIEEPILSYDDIFFLKLYPLLWLVVGVSDGLPSIKGYIKSNYEVKKLSIEIIESQIM